MTREEQIKEAGAVTGKRLGHWWNGFVKGALWADSNPSLSTQKIFSDELRQRKRIQELESKLEIAEGALEQAQKDLHTTLCKGCGEDIHNICCHQIGKTLSRIRSLE